jgi:hypothetical protein
MNQLFVFGSEDFAFDNGAVKLIGWLAKQLPNWQITRMLRPEQLMQHIGEDFVILDVAEGIDKPFLITDLDNLTYESRVTAHDLDLAAFLKIMRELGQIHNVDIIAVPNNKEPDKDAVLKLIKGLE